MIDTIDGILYTVLVTVGFSLMLVIVVQLLVAFCATMRGEGVGSRGSGTATHADQEEDGHGAGLSAGELVRLPSHNFKSADGGATDCAVCLEAFEAGDKCRQLPRCAHSFHAECVDSWLRKSSACPVCRADVMDRPPKGEAKAAASSGVVETSERRGSNAALEIVVTER